MSMAQQEHTPSLLGSHAAPNPRAAAGHTSGTQACGHHCTLEHQSCRPGWAVGSRQWLWAARPGAGRSVTVRLLAGLAAGCRAALEGALAVAIGLAPHRAVHRLHRRARAHAGFCCKAKVGAWGGAGPLREGGEPRAARKQRKAVNGTARPERPASKALSSLGTAWQGRESSRALEVLRFLLPVLLKPRAETKGLLATSSSSSSSFCPPGDPFGLAAHAWSSSAESQLFLA